MLNRLTNDIDFTDDFYILSLVSHLKDYSLCFQINDLLNLDFEKYEDFFKLNSEQEDNAQGFSWYYYFDDNSSSSYYLIGNKCGGRRLIPSQKQVDFFLLIKETAGNVSIKELATSLRCTKDIIAVIPNDLSKIKDINILLQEIELHEMEYVSK